MAAEFSFELKETTLYLKGDATIESLPKGFEVFSGRVSEDVLARIEVVDLSGVLEIDSLLWAFLLWLQTQTKSTLELKCLPEKLKTLSVLYGLASNFHFEG